MAVIRYQYISNILDYICTADCNYDIRHFPRCWHGNSSFCSCKHVPGCEIFENRVHKLVINKTTNYLKYVPVSLTKGKAISSECMYHHLTTYKLILSFVHIFFSIF